MKYLFLLFLLVTNVCFAQKQSAVGTSSIKLQTGSQIASHTLSELLIKPYVNSSKVIDITDEFVSIASNTATANISALSWNRFATAGVSMASPTVNAGEFGRLLLNSGTVVGNFNSLSLNSVSGTSTGLMIAQVGDTMTFIVGVPAGMTTTNYSTLSVGIASNSCVFPINTLTLTPSNFLAVSFNPVTGISLDVAGQGSTFLGNFATSTYRVKLFYSNFTNIWFVEVIDLFTNTIVGSSFIQYIAASASALPHRPFFHVYKNAGTTSHLHSFDFFNFKRVNLNR